MLGNKGWHFMSTIFHIMKEEYDRLTEAEQVYRKNIALMPKGTPRIKNIRNKDYLYLTRREGAKVVDEYIGVADSDKAKKIIEQVNKRKKFTQLLKETKKMLKDVKKVLRGKI
jgi:hypothetical protein